MVQEVAQSHVFEAALGSKEYVLERGKTNWSQLSIVSLFLARNATAIRAFIARMMFLGVEVVKGF